MPAPGCTADLHLAVLRDAGGTVHPLTSHQCRILHGARLSEAELRLHLHPLLDAGLVVLHPAADVLPDAPPDTLPRLWADAVAAFPARPWLIPAEEDGAGEGAPVTCAPVTCAEVTYAEAAGLVDALARRLTAAGLRGGDRVLVHTAPGPDTALLFWACARLGLVFAPLDGAAGADARHRAEELVRPALLVAADRPLRLPDDPAEGGTGDPPGEDDLAVILFTSGTTGDPKGVELSHGALVRSARLMAGGCGIGPEDRLLSLGEFHTMSGLRNPLIVTAAAGAAAVLAGEGERRHPIGALDLCRRQGVTVLSAVPAFLKVLGGMAGRIGPDASGTLRLILSTAADLPDGLAAAVRRITGAPVVNYYGLTETCGCCALVPPAEAGEAGDSIGRPAGAVCQIVDGEGRVLGVGEVGELRVHSANLMTGYHRRPDLTAGILRDGWLYTGDLAERRPDGHLRLVGRRRDIVKTARGDLLALGAVERLLEEDPAVEEAAVCGYRDARGDERTLGFVRLAEGEDAATVLSRLKALMLDRLGARNAPAGLLARADFPRGANGKVLKHALMQESHPDE